MKLMVQIAHLTAGPNLFRFQMDNNNIEDQVIKYHSSPGHQRRLIRCCRELVVQVEVMRRRLVLVTEDLDTPPVQHFFSSLDGTVPPIPVPRLFCPS